MIYFLMAVGVKSEIKKPRESSPVTVPQLTNSMQLAKDGTNVVLVPLSISVPMIHVIQIISFMNSVSTMLLCASTVKSTLKNAL